MISHGYADIDMAVVWTIVDQHLDPLVAELEALLSRH
ncbi:MAG TPA: hypothetical protein GX694_00125 [Actinomycetales bacterium]|nr:hypothetical protein [Actinomycetales bacterium]